MGRTEEEIIEKYTNANNATKDLVKISLGLDIGEQLSADKLGKMLAEADPKTCQIVESWLFKEDDVQTCSKKTESAANTNLVDYFQRSRADEKEKMYIYEDIIEIRYKWDPSDLGFDICAKLILDFRDDNVNVSLYPDDSVESLIGRFGTKATRKDQDMVMEQDDWHIHFARRSEDGKLYFYYHEYILEYSYEKIRTAKELIFYKLHDFLKKMKDMFGKEDDIVEVDEE